MGLVKADEIAIALKAFKSSGKPVIAYSEYYSQNTYYLASQADEIYMNPMGGVMLQGFGVYRNYFKNLLDTLKIKFHVFRVGEYKSALEPFMRNDMSESAKQANLDWLQRVWESYLDTIAQARHLSAAELQRSVDNFDAVMQSVNGDAGLMATKLGLVDELFDRPSMEEVLLNRFGESINGGPKLLPMHAYLMQHKMTVSGSSLPKVAVVVAQGEIIDGDSVPGAVGGDSLAALIQKAEKDDDVRAMVLRIDSPGGSVFASEVIRRELARFQASGKPLVISMSSLAASGGYWISAGADKIFASDKTLTGSIGIFGAIPTLEDSLQSIGVNTDGVGTSKLANAYRVDMPMNPVAASIIQQGIEFGYRQFLDIVAQGRGMTVEEVDHVARGRVWTGSHALEKGLVDANGQLDAALDAAAELAELGDQYEAKWIRPVMTPWEAFMESIVQAKQDGFEVLLKNMSFGALALKQPWYLKDPRHSYVLCTDCSSP
jgi:protease-4